jgi:hypothetical protein
MKDTLGNKLLAGDEVRYETGKGVYMFFRTR